MINGEPAHTVIMKHQETRTHIRGYLYMYLNMSAIDYVNSIPSSTQQHDDPKIEFPIRYRLYRTKSMMLGSSIKAQIDSNGVKLQMNKDFVSFKVTNFFVFNRKNFLKMSPNVI